MLLDYTLKKDISQFKVQYYGLINFKFRPFHKILVYNLVEKLTGFTRFNITFTEDLENINLLVTLPTKNVLKICLNSDIITIKYNNITYYFAPNYSFKEIDITLKKLAITCPDKEIIEEFKTHLVDFKVALSNKLYELSLPYDTDYVLDYNVFSSLSANSTMQDLIKIYETQFAPTQGSYNYEKALTTFNIYESSLLKENICLQNGVVSSFEYHQYLSPVDIKVTKHAHAEPLITISGLTLDFNMDLNSEIKTLLAKVPQETNRVTLKRIK